MIQLKTITARNFLSIGNATQSVDLNRTDLTLVLGENLDLGGDGARNGVGKTVMLNAVSYALYGQALTNIKKDNLINKTNNREQMLVTLDFAINDKNYRIERGRRPAVLKFYVDKTEKISTDNAQGDSRETQADIERLIGMSHDMFKHVVALNTYTEPFLNLRANDQRVIIEQLLGITLLSERAEKIKELNKQTKDGISHEEMRIRAVQEANKRIEEQIENLRKRQRLWSAKRDEDVSKLSQAIADLEHIDIDAEIQAHRDLESFHVKKKAIDDATMWIRKIDAENIRLQKLGESLRKDIESLNDHKCHSCGNEIHDQTQDELKKSKELEHQECALQQLANLTQQDGHETTLKNLGELGIAPTVFYDNLEMALNHRNSVEGLKKDLAARSADVDPYQEQINDMQGQALQTINYDHINELTRLQDHQEFLLKLLTNKDSFVRKKIIEQNLNYLNLRLTHYLNKIGLPHQVEFKNDLSVEISELGRDLDFDNLSRGERNRLILSLSWAFRDVWENLYQSINVMFVDEMIDSGLDTQGVESALGLLKTMSRERHKSIWLVSHRDELISRVDNILRVVKENGFTSYNNEYQ